MIAFAIRVFFALTTCFITNSLQAQSTENKEPSAIERPFPKETQESQEKGRDTPPYFPLEEGSEEEDFGQMRFWEEFIQMLGTLALLIALLFGASWLMRRMTSSRVQYANVTSQIKILEQRSLSQKTALYLIEVGDERVVVADSQTGVTKILNVKKTEGKKDFASIAAGDRPAP